MPSGSVDIWVAAIASLLGGIGLKLTEWLLSKKQKEQEDVKDARLELQHRYDNAEKKIEELKKEVDLWRRKYYDLLEDRIDQFVAMIMSGDATMDDVRKFIERNQEDA